MGKIDYKKLKLQIGLEIHQELSGKKLFCNCSTDLKEEILVDGVKRRLRSSAGETGDVDIASEFEQSKNREFIYYGYENEYCLVEMDSEPPHEINMDALKTALELCVFFNLVILAELYSMRKIISDGSVVSGFQRTILLGMGSKDSYIETSQSKVGIDLICLEEDACKIIKKEGNRVYFSLSRSGIPLIEIATKPDIKSPEQAKEAAQKIGMILRSFPLIKRGIGTIRQDVNLSIKNGARVELKGFQDLRSMPKVIENEIKRQLNLIKKGKKIKEEVRKVEPDLTSSFLRPMPGAARLYPETDHPSIRVTKKMLSELQKHELISEKVLRLEKDFKLNSETARLLIKNNCIDIFEKIMLNCKLNSNFVAESLVSIPKELKRKYKRGYDMNENQEFVLFVFELLNKNEISKDSIFDIFLDNVNGELDIEKYKILDEKKIKKEIKKIIKKNRDVSFNGIMGDIMKKFNGRVDGGRVAKIVKRML